MTIAMRSLKKNEMSPTTPKKSAARKRTPPARPRQGRSAPQVLLDLLNARGPSGYETAPAAVWRDAAKGFAEVSTDVVGTPLALVAPEARRRAARRGALLVMGHIDEIGLIVTHIDDQGYLWFGSVGGWDAQILVGQRVVLDTRAGRSRAWWARSRSTCCARTSARRWRRSVTCTSTSARVTAMTRASGCGSATWR